MRRPAEAPLRQRMECVKVKRALSLQCVIKRPTWSFQSERANHVCVQLVTYDDVNLKRLLPNEAARNSEVCKEITEKPW